MRFPAALGGTLAWLAAGSRRPAILSQHDNRDAVLAGRTHGYTFRVDGEPRPGGSKKAFPIRRNGEIVRHVVVDAAKGGKQWREAVQHQVRQQFGREPFDGPVSLLMTFYRRRPKSHFGTGANADTLKPSAPPFPTTRPDVLKLARAAEDAMTGLVYVDDAQIVDEHLQKRWGEPGVDIRVEELDPIFGDVQTLRAVA